jgi:hypothetical protein
MDVRALVVVKKNPVLSKLVGIVDEAIRAV